MAPRNVLLVLLAALLALAVLRALAAGPGADPRGTRIVLITLDTLRYDSFSGGEARPSSMPALRSFARTGQIFERFYAATASTQPSHASLLTGLHPWEHGVTRNGTVLAPRYETLAERLRTAGYRTGAVVASFPLAPRFGFAQGFDRYVAEFDVGVEFGEWEQMEIDPNHFYSLADAVTDRALALLDELGGSRQFLWLHYFDPHDPYGDRGVEKIQLWQLYDLALAREPTLPDRIRLARLNYERDVAALDRALGRVLMRLRGDLDRYDTHVVVTSDHGESFGEEGSLGHGVRLTPEQVHVPLLVVSPRFEPGVRRDPAGSVDVAATLLAMAGIDAGDMRGRDLAAGQPAGDPQVVGMSRTFSAPWKDIRTDGEAIALREPRFFWVRQGRLLAGDAQAVVEGDAAGRPAADAVAGPARELFASFERRLRRAGTTELTDEETQRALRALGYAQ